MSLFSLHCDKIEASWSNYGISTMSLMIILCFSSGPLNAASHDPEKQKMFMKEDWLTPGLDLLCRKMSQSSHQSAVHIQPGVKRIKILTGTMALNQGKSLKELPEAGIGNSFQHLVLSPKARIRFAGIRSLNHPLSQHPGASCRHQRCPFRGLSWGSRDTFIRISSWHINHHRLPLGF